ncbi:MAG: hypothetical protein K2N52_03080 [Clostridia bacterium]|nr:hypothetical protein [Clostridia bacterium]
MILQNFGAIPPRGKVEGVDKELIAMAEGLFEKVKNAVDRLNAPEALSEIFAVISRANKYIDETTPWILAKDESKKERLGAVLYNLAETVRICSVMLKPFITKAPGLILKSFSCDENEGFGSLEFGKLKVGAKIEKLPPVFPRVDVKKELAEVEKLVAKLKKTEVKEVVEEKAKEIITIDDFAKVEMRVGTVIECEPVKKSRLLHETVSIGAKNISVLSGIAEHYTADEMVGKRVIVVTNLPPREMKGILSEGMIICAQSPEGKLSIVSPEKDLPDGSLLS